MSKKYKNICTSLNHIEHFLILAFAFTDCILVSDFSSSPGIPIGITSSIVA